MPATLVSCRDRGHKELSARLGPGKSVASGYPLTELDGVTHDRLLEQAASDRGTEGFPAVLKLRDVGDERAIPVLERVLADNIHTTRSHGFAAAQALFCIGGKRAHNILRKYLLSDEYDAALGIRYVFHWRMPEAKRDAFIEQYHLQSTSSDIEIKVKATRVTVKHKSEISFGIELRNVSKKPLRLHRPRAYTGNLLLIRSADGRPVRRVTTTLYRRPARTKACFPEVAANSALTLHIVAKVRWQDRGLFKRDVLVLDCRDMHHLVGGPGKFTVYVMYYVPKRLAEWQAKRLGLKGVWYGRVVSEPVEIEIKEPGRE